MADGVRSFGVWLFIACLGSVVVAGCASPGPYNINLMPAPDVYKEGEITPFTDTNMLSESALQGLLYATDRVPVDPQSTASKQERFYLNERGGLIRLGVASFSLGEANMTWEEARRISLAKNRTEEYPLKVTDVEEFGILDRSFHPFVDAETRAQESNEPAQRFAQLVNAKLEISEKKDIFIYVHGYKVVFDNPVLVAAELWHYLGYEGVFVAYAWPSTPSRWAYFADAETTATSAFHFGTLLEYLAEQTDAERIHIIGYSQGTRMVVDGVYRLALKYQDETPEEAQKHLRIGKIILIGSDIDRQLMGSYIVDGLLDAMDNVTVYVSSRDKALGLSRFLLGRQRLGEMFGEGEIRPEVEAFLEDNAELQFINVTEAEGALTGNGHGYFRSSPWASSDILMTLRYGLEPEDRGLVHTEGLPVWTFPADYIDRLRAAIIQVNPGLKEALESNRTEAEP
ncbi:MAG: alpha/beta hydrolase [Betaproteobacteria bacterium]|nr:MAG: alpha/beta hydrolase [Betaproteobacteria bacterium]